MSVPDLYTSVVIWLQTKMYCSKWLWRPEGLLHRFAHFTFIVYGLVLRLFWISLKFDLRMFIIQMKIMLVCVKMFNLFIFFRSFVQSYARSVSWTIKFFIRIVPTPINLIVPEWILFPIIKVSMTDRYHQYWNFFWIQNGHKIGKKTLNALKWGKV